jgi:hypothetical protein
MAKKGFLLGMLAMVLVFGLVSTGCDISTSDADGDGYTFKVKVDNYSNSTITKLEFINGNTQNDTVLKTASLSLTSGSRSSEYSVSGFTVEAGSTTHYCGVKVTFSGGTSRFGYTTAGHGSKLLLRMTDSVGSFSEGNW